MAHTPEKLEDLDLEIAAKEREFVSLSGEGHPLKEGEEGNSTEFMGIDRRQRRNRQQKEGPTLPLKMIGKPGFCESSVSARRKAYKPQAGPALKPTKHPRRGARSTLKKP